MPSTIKNFRSAISLAFMLFRATLVVAAKNRISFENMLEEYYYACLKEVDINVYNDEVFGHVSSRLDKKDGQRHIAHWWSSISLALLFLCVFDLLKNVSFYGTVIDPRRYNPLIIMVYSFSNLRIALLRFPIASRQALLKAHARLKTNDQSTDLYFMRYPDQAVPKFVPSRFVLPAVFSNLLRRVLILTIKYGSLLILSFPIYVILYLLVAIDVLLVSDMDFWLRLSLVIASMIAEFSAISVSLLLSYAATRDPEAVKKFWADVIATIKEVWQKHSTDRIDPPQDSSTPL
jgi:hypothetical protein